MMKKFNELPKDFADLEDPTSENFSMEKLEELERVLNETLKNLGLDKEMGDLNSGGNFGLSEEELGLSKRFLNNRFR